MEKTIQINQKTETFKNILTYVLAASISLAAVCFSAKVWMIDLNIPIVSGGDSLWISTTVKNFVDGGDFYHYVNLGMPFDGADRFIFPVTSYVSLGILKLMSFFSSNYGLVLNLYAIGTFPLTAVIALFALRRLKISRIIGCMAAVLYATLYYHYVRFEGHLHVASYFMIPLICVAAFWVMRGELIKPVMEDGMQSKLNKLFGKYDAGKLCFCVIACIGVGFSEAYYQMFSLMIVFFVGLYAWISQKNYRHFIVALIMIFVIICSMLPWMFFSFWGSGSDYSGFMSATRNAGDVEIYGLKFTHLILPNGQSRIPALAAFTNNYISETPLNNENGTASLGIVASIGFLYSLFVVMFQKLRKNDKDIEYCGKINLYMFLLATIGGIGSLIAFIVPVTSAARCYNRMSIFIAFFSLLAICYLLQRVQKKIKKKSAMAIFLAGVVALMMFGVYDQNPGKPLSSQQKNQEFMQKAQYFENIQQELPQNAKMLQLPVVSSGIYSDYNEIGAYESLWPYILSKDLKFSYGADEGSYEEAWLYSLERQPTDKMVRDAVIVGFDGILIDRYGYLNRDTGLLEKKIASITGDEPLVSQEGRYAFFNLADYAQIMRMQYTEGELNAMKDELLHSVVISYNSGFYPVEPQENGETSRWAMEEASLKIENRTGEAQNVRVSMSVSTIYDQPYTLTVRNDGCDIERFETTSEMKECLFDITVEPGTTIIELSSDIPRPDPGLDPRDLHFMIRNLNLEIVGI